MNVFISCSGSLSKKVAKLLHSWLPEVNQRIEAWLYSEDIDKGAMWPEEVNKALETTVGILCVTQQNKNAPWLLFEAGALSKGLSEARVCPFLIDLEPQDVKPPLSQFNLTLPDKDDVWQLLKTINDADPEKALSDDRLQKSLDRVWREFEKPFQEIREAHKEEGNPPPRSVDDMVVEILEITRELQRNSEELLLSTKPASAVLKSGGISGALVEALRRLNVLEEPTNHALRLYQERIEKALKEPPKKAPKKPPEKPADKSA
jgi:hypothetical protein